MLGSRVGPPVVLVGLLAACLPGLERADALCPESCGEAPAPECLNGELRTFAGPGECSLATGTCRFDQRTAPCEHGCADTTRCRAVGDLLWTADGQAAMVGISADGSVVVSDGLGLRALSLDGQPRAGYAWPAPRTDAPASLALAPDDSVLVHARRVVSFGQYHGVLHRIGADGVELFEHALGANASGLAVTSEGASVVRVVQRLVRVSADGAEDWTRDFPVGFGPLALTSEGAVLACGSGVCAGFSAGGALRWQRDLPLVSATGVDADDVFVVGADADLLRLDPATGSTLASWSALTVAPGLDGAVIRGHVVEPTGDLVVAAAVERVTPPSRRHFLARLARGSLTTLLAVELDDEPSEVVAAEDGSLYVLSKRWLASYSPALERSWRLALPAATTSAAGLVVHPSGRALFCTSPLGCMAVLVQSPQASTRWPTFTGARLSTRRAGPR